MRFVFVHQNFPGQFKHLAPALAAQGHEVWALGIHQPEAPLPGVRHVLVIVAVPSTSPHHVVSFPAFSPLPIYAVNLSGGLVSSSYCSTRPRMALSHAAYSGCAASSAVKGRILRPAPPMRSA